MRHKGVSLSRIGRKEEALYYLDSSIKTKPDFWRAYVNKALILEDIGEDEKVLEIYELITSKMDKNKDSKLIELVNFKIYALKGKEEDTQIDVLNDIINNLQDKQIDFFSDINTIESVP